MRSYSIFALTAAVGLCLSAEGASADTTMGLTFQQSSTTPYIWGALIGNSIATNDPITQANPLGNFTDLFTFTDPVTPANAIAVGSTDAISLTGTGPLTFSSITLLDQTNNSTVQTGIISMNILGQSIANIFGFILPNNTDSYAIQLIGNVGNGGTASYGGSVNISAVPEPETYAMLLAGLGLLAFTARRRKTSFY